MISERLTLLLLAALMAVSTDLYLPALPVIVSELQSTEAGGQLTLSLFMAGAALGQLIYGPLSDYFGRKPVLTAGLCLFIAASLACSLAPSMEWLYAGRLLQGLAAACGPVLARAIVSDRYEGREAASVMAGIAGAMALIPALAPIVGGWIMLIAPWPAQFLTLGGIALVAWVGALGLMESAPNIRQGELSGRHIAKQLLSCLQHRRFMGYALCGGGAYGAMFVWISTSPFIVIDLVGLAPEYYGYTFMVVAAGYITGARLSSRYVVALGTDILIARGLMIGFFGAATLLLQGALSVHGLPGLLASTFCVFLGGGLTLANSQMAAITRLPDRAGSASSAFGFVQLLLVSASGLLAGQLYNDSALMPGAAMLLALLIALTGFSLREDSPAPTSAP